MWLINMFLNLTTGPWYLDLVTLAGIVGAALMIWRSVLAPFGRALWAAIVAAPKIVESAETLIALLEGEVLTRMADHEARLITLANRMLVIERAGKED